MADRPLPHATIGELDTALVEFAEYYNQHRPHRGLHGRTPAEVFPATTAARPADRPLPATLSVRRCWTSNAGVVPVGLHHVVALGARWKRIPVTVIRDGDHVAVYAGNRLIRTLDIDPTRTYQPPGTKAPNTS